MRSSRPILVVGFKNDLVVATRYVIFDVVNRLQHHEELNVTRKRVHLQPGKSSIGNMNIQDILKVFLSLLDLPKFAAVNLNALPRTPYEAHGFNQLSERNKLKSPNSKIW